MIKTLVKTHVAPTLAEHRFRKKALIWNRKWEGVTQVINIQTSRTNGPGSRFTLNLGVFVDQVWATCWEKATPAFVKEVDCFPRLRVGRLLGEPISRQLDRWWYLESEADILSVGEEIKEILEGKCIPLLDSVTNLETALDLAQRLRSDMPLDRLCLAILRYLLGEIEPAQRELTLLSSDPYWGKKSDEIQSRLHAMSDRS